MISAVNSSPSFTSVIPVRVTMDGKVTRIPKLVNQACKKLNVILTTQIKDEKARNITELFARYDKDYKHAVTARPSELIRTLPNGGDNFLLTGPDAVRTKNTGNIFRQAETEFDRMFARQTYKSNANYMRKYRRLKNADGKPLVLEINMISNKKYGQSNFVTDVDSIRFLANA